MKYFYTYCSFEVNGLCYIGKRECLCVPEEDQSYLGSFSNTNFNPTEKVILSVHLSSKEALEEEVRLHHLWDVDHNEGFANLAKQHGSGFHYDWSGKKRPELSERNKSPEARERAKQRAASADHPFRKLKKSKPPRVLKRPSTSLSMTGEGNHRFGTKNPEHAEFMKEQMTGRKHWINSSGDTRFQRESPGPEWQNGRIFRQTK
jgi:hypothetical protein